MLPNVISGLIEARVSLQRVEKFLLMEELGITYYPHVHHTRARWLVGLSRVGWLVDWFVPRWLVCRALVRWLVWLSAALW